MGAHTPINVHSSHKPPLLYLCPHVMWMEVFYFTTEIFCRRLMFEVAWLIGNLYRNWVQNLGGDPSLEFGSLKPTPISVNFRLIFHFAGPVLRNGPRYCQSKNGLLNKRHSSIRQWKNGVLWSTMKYMIAAHSHPPCNLFSSIFTKRLDRWRHMGGGILTRWSSVELIFYFKCTLARNRNKSTHLLSVSLFWYPLSPVCHT